MIVRKTLSLNAILRFTGQHMVWLVPWMLIVTWIYYCTEWKFMILPWLPLSLIGTAVAFYVGFKNNHSYERLWEARIIWGSMVNNSRMFSTMIKNFKSEDLKGESAEDIRSEMVRRHIAYLYQLREQLLRPARWEHVSLNWIFGSLNQRRRDRLFNRFQKEIDELSTRTYLSAEERNGLEGFNNKATQLLDKQTRCVQELFERKVINWAQQQSLQDSINGFYESQGRAERIKNTPLPRKYASFSFVFVCIFVFLLPFGIVGEFSKIGPEYVWLAVPVGSIIGWIYVTMELIGDYSENPFEGLHNDIPMLSICRTIEIDLLQMMGEKDVPQPIQPKDRFLI